MTQSTQQTTSINADLWIGIANALVHDAKWLREIVDRTACHMIANDTQLTTSGQAELNRAIYMTSQIALLLREQITTAISLEYAQLQRGD